MNTVITSAAAILVCAFAATGVAAQTTLYQGAGTNLDGTITPDITSPQGRSVSFLVNFNPSSTADASTNLHGGALINELAGGYSTYTPGFYDSQLEVEDDGTVLASVYDYAHILNLGKATFGRNNIASFAYDAETGTFLGVLNGVSAIPYVAGSDVRQTPSDYNYTDVYYGIGTVQGGAYLGIYTEPGYDPINSSGGQAFDGTITSVTIDTSGQLLAPSAGAVPEPASWAMMIGGFGLVGGGMRRRRSQAGLVIA